MNTLIINGSPRVKGETNALVKAFISELEGHYEIINIFNGKPIKPCLDCGSCLSEAGCIQDDYFNDVLKQIAMADVIVLASPMWFGNISGPLMSYMSRINTLANGYNERKDLVHKFDKAGIFLMSSGAKWQGMAKSVEATVEFLFKEMDAMIYDCIYANKSDLLPVINNEQAIYKAKHAALNINKWYQAKCNGSYYKYGYSSYNYLEYEDNKIVI